MDRVCEVVAATRAEAVVAEAIVLARRPRADWGVDVALARVRALAGHYSDGNHAADEAEVKDERQEGEERDAAEAACKDGREDGVNNADARDALNRLLPSWNGSVAI